MFKNYLITAWRYIKRHKGFSFINISGLAVGMACCILILLWVQDELSYDRFHENKDDIYRVVSDWERYNWNGVEGTPEPLAQVIKDEIPEIIHSSRFASYSRLVFKYGAKAFYEDGGIIADPSLFKIFTFPFVKGNAETAFLHPTDIVITESMAQRYFRDENPIGKIMEVEGRLGTITGVIKDIPPNSHIQFDFMSSFEFIKEISGWGTGWGSFNFVTYVLLQKDRNLKDIAQKMTGIALKNSCPQVQSGAHFRLQPLSKVHLDARIYKRSWVALGDSKYVYLFSIIAFFVLLIACVNFMNLSTARSALRAKEVGMRKTIGAHRMQLIKQFFGESMFFALVAFIIAMTIVLLLLRVFNQLSGKQLTISFLDFRIISCFVAVILLTGLIAGIYPALYLSAFKAVTVLKGVVKSGRKGSSFRRVLVVIQFSLSIVLIIGTTVIYRQLHYMKNKELGFDKQNIIYIPIKENIARNYEAVKDELLRNPEILSVSAHRYLFATETNRAAGWNWEGRDPDRVPLDLILSGVDYDFFNTLNLEIVEGRAFSKEFPSDTKQAFILNEAAIKEMGLESPVGKWFHMHKREGTIIGVVKDAHFRSFYQKIEPRLFYITDVSSATSGGIVLIKINGERVTETLSVIKGVWERINPISPFEYHFLDQTYDRLYRKEQQTIIIFNYFTFLAVLISCLGLFGLASFMAEQRTKEIGIRKILGANVSEIVVLLSKEFTRWVLLSNIIAWPIGYFVMNKLLQVYAYRINIGLEIFIFSGFLALAIALLTISYQAFKAALTNPADALRYE